MTITHVAHLIGGPEDGQQYAVEEDGSLDLRYKGPRLVITIAQAPSFNEAMGDPGASVHVVEHKYLREPMPAPHLSTLTEDHWRYHYAGVAERSDHAGH